MEDHRKLTMQHKKKDQSEKELMDAINKYLRTKQTRLRMAKDAFAKKEVP